MVTYMSVLSAITDTFSGNLIFQTKVLDGCHDMTQKPLSSNDAEIVTVKRNDCMIHFWNMTKTENVN